MSPRRLVLVYGTWKLYTSSKNRSFIGNLKHIKPSSNNTSFLRTCWKKVYKKIGVLHLNYVQNRSMLKLSCQLTQLMVNVWVIPRQTFVLPSGNIYMTIKGCFGVGKHLSPSQNDVCEGLTKFCNINHHWVGLYFKGTVKRKHRVQTRGLYLKSWQKWQPIKVN